MKQNKKLVLAVFSAFLASVPWGVEAVPAVPNPQIRIPQAKGAPELSTPSASVEKKSSASFYLHKVVVETGNLKLDKAAMEEIAKPYGKQVTDMGKLSALTEELTRYVRSHGYPSALVYLPAQEVERATLKVAVLPGQIGKVNINNQSSLSDKTVQRLLKGIRSGDIITSRSIEKALFNVNDLAGVKAAGVLSPGQQSGTSDLTVTVTNTKKSQTLLYAENYGNKNTGRYRYGLQETLNNLSGQGDMLRIGALISNKDLRNYYVTYEVPTGRSGTIAGLGFSHMNYETNILGMEGKADTLSVYGRTPLIHTSKHYLAATYGYDYRKLKDEIANFNLNPDRHTHGVHVGLMGSERRPGSFLGYDVTLTRGTASLDSADARAIYGNARTEGSFTKTNLRLSAVHDLRHNFDILVKAQGQWTNRNLDSSEKIYLGGAQGVRAYPQGEGSGDEGILATAELRYHTKVPGLMLSCYLDGGNVHHIKNMVGSTHLLGWGLGVTYSRPQNFFARFDYARRIGTPDNVGNESLAKQRMWFILGKIF
ncbi:Hemolysin activation/secretion protein [Selenomonas ruminantium]|uniref:Hemolysin activation/secretion protein n=1 Tax=Selenomonas ruminantium TaxID=971 RepID=A0A1M6QWC8_SELRU|nr:ShlB/FhaC/HecB family hemolysin secretion/activation protein [Selenomonas ruminantium]SHK24505.1 Hemolysin activation/secretion protein [Selenomonas ruminantium]